MQYDAVVPEDLEVTKIPTGTGNAWSTNLTRREAIDRASRVYKRGVKFAKALRRRKGGEKV
jgi:diacylglycerol kinase family enzyme